MKKFFIGLSSVLIITALGVGFWAGMKWQKIQQVDTCLEAGGGIQAGSNICVLKK